MKKSTLLTLFGVLCLLTACNKDEAPTIYLGMGTVQKNPASYSILFDNNQDFTVTDSIALVLTGTNRQGQRVITSFSYQTDERDQPSYIYLYRVMPILTKPFFKNPTGLESDSLGNDPVGIKSAWISGGHLNIEFSYRSGKYSTTTHFISMADYGLTSSSGNAMLEFRHNANRDSENCYRTGYVSFVLPDDPPAAYDISYKGLDMREHTLTVNLQDSTQKGKLQLTDGPSLK